MSSPSPFLEKLSRGQATTAEEWIAFLVEAHASAPGMTPSAFGAFRTEGGQSSYERLAGTVSELGTHPAPHVLDLACGDGPLTALVLGALGPDATVSAVDMSMDELQAARRRVTDPRARFLKARAQALPLANASVDAALCHMAFMLMTPLEPVIDELARVLKPGAAFRAIVGGPQVGAGLYAELRAASLELALARFPGLRNAVTGDRRIHSSEGLDRLFSPERGFEGPTEIVTFPVRSRVDADGAWSFMKDMYYVSMLDRSDLAACESRVRALAEEHAGPDGLACLEFPMVLLEARRA